MNVIQAFDSINSPNIGLKLNHVSFGALKGSKRLFFVFLYSSAAYQLSPASGLEVVEREGVCCFYLSL